MPLPLPPGSLLASSSPTALLCVVLNRLLMQNDEARLLLAAHGGRSFEIQAPPVAAKLMIDPEGKLSPSESDEPAQVALTVDTQALWAAGWRPGQPMPDQAGVLHISGDAAMAQTLSILAKHWRPDLEDLLAQKIGDIAARQVMRAAQGFLGAFKRSTSRLAENMAEYVTHETQALPSMSQFMVSGTQQTTLTNRLAVLDERVAQLEGRVNQLAGSQSS